MRPWEETFGSFEPRTLLSTIWFILTCVACVVRHSDDEKNTLLGTFEDLSFTVFLVNRTRFWYHQTLD